MSQVVTVYPQACRQANIVISQARSSANTTAQIIGAPVVVEQPKFIYNQARGFKVGLVLGIQLRVLPALKNPADWAKSLIKANLNGVRRALEDNGFPIIDDLQAADNGVSFKGSANGMGMNDLHADIQADSENTFWTTAKVPVLISKIAQRPDFNVDVTNIEIQSIESGTALWHVIDEDGDEIDEIEQSVESLAVSALSSVLTSQINKQIITDISKMIDLQA